MNATDRAALVQDILEGIEKLRARSERRSRPERFLVSPADLALIKEWCLRNPDYRSGSF